MSFPARSSEDFQDSPTSLKLLPLAQVPGNLFLIQRKIFCSHTLFTSMGLGNKSLGTSLSRKKQTRRACHMPEQEQGRVTIRGKILHHRLTKPSVCHICPHEPPRREGLPHSHQESTSQVPGREASSDRKERADLPMSPALNELFPLRAGSQAGVMWPPGDIWPCLETFSVAMAGARRSGEVG